MKSIIWPFFHNFRLRADICVKTNPWGLISQSEIKKLVSLKVPDNISKSFPDNLQERSFFNQAVFLEGARLGYREIFKSFSNNIDYLEENYTTPKLSLALNQILSEHQINPRLNLNKIDAEILGIWNDIGHATANDKVLGHWCNETIKHELIAGGLGPEVRIIWDQKPIKQKVKVLYNVNNRIDVWEWERCLMMTNYNWTISNINGVIIS
ncbi:hypothetical protein CPAV1605_1239 [seawater metagenome]|uniref:Tim44-like domain-containing protein n=1 Tax=seawater metagenome TaxID=1561972 RepID=A0A5E8CJH2_9ZZZZ